MKTVREILGETNWATLKKSPNHDLIRNCAVKDVTVEEIILISDCLLDLDLNVAQLFISAVELVKIHP